MVLGSPAADELDVRHLSKRATAACSTVQLEGRGGILRDAMPSSHSVAAHCVSIRRCGINETMYLAELHQDLPASDRNAACGEVMHDLVNDIVRSWIHQPGRHDLQRVYGAAFLWQAEPCAGPEADQHVAAPDHTVLDVISRNARRILYRLQHQHLKCLVHFA